MVKFRHSEGCGKPAVQGSCQSPYGKPCHSPYSRADAEIAQCIRARVRACMYAAHSALACVHAHACDHAVGAGVRGPQSPYLPTPPPKSSQSTVSSSFNGNEVSGRRSAQAGPGTRRRTGLMRGQTSYLSDALLVPGQRATAYGPSATVAAIAPSTHGLWPATVAVAEVNTGRRRVNFGGGELASVQAPSARKKEAGQPKLRENIPGPGGVKHRSAPRNIGSVG